MEIKKSDILDRWTILKIKAKYDKNAQEELGLYRKSVIELLYNTVDKIDLYNLLESIVEMMEANARSWENESSIRNECQKDPSNTHLVVEGKEHSIEELAEIGRRALLIRTYNRFRINAKTKIDTNFGQIIDKKVNHASE